ncbi:MAG: hotdog fold thioesterase [Flavobacteriales bacterium]|nr:hotdog fold thioesterase [Flavobacteriales bacterium]
MFTPEHVQQANALTAGTLMETLGIRYALADDGALVATMPVGPAVHQPMGLLHGGATVALAESLGSCGSFLVIDPGTQGVVGIEVNANHIKGVRSGTITATGTLMHQGRSTHVWDIRITDEEGALVALCRITNLIITKR